MLAGRRQSVEQLFEAALALAPGERQAFLRSACKVTPELEPLVQELLRQEQMLGSFLEKPPFIPSKAPSEGSSDLCKTATFTDLSWGSEHRETDFPRFVAGEVINDRFIIVRFIARGGMGEVYEVEDRQLQGVHLALKTIPIHMADDPAMQKRFEREVLRAREVSHPNLCPIYDLFHCHQQGIHFTFLTMKLLSGETLASRIAREGRISLREASSVIRQLGAAVIAAHDAGFLHRDIKASNIMLDGSGDDVRVCVLDFGLAHSFVVENYSLTAATLAGTPAYMAPELFRGQPPSKCTDVYAMGVVAYEILTGSLPHLSSGKGIETGDYQSCDELPPEWKRFVRGCLEPDPSRRYQGVEAALAVVWPAEYMASEHGANHHYLTRRQVIKLGTGASLAMAGGLWFEWPKINNRLHPLPDRRFVALMAWPAVPDESAAIVSAVLGSIRNRLTKAESYVKNLLIISPDDLIGNRPAFMAPADSISILGANLVLAASLHSTTSKVTLLLQVLDAATQRTLRKHSISSNRSKLSALSEKGPTEAVKLLGLPEIEKPVTDADELQGLSPEAFLSFSSAEQFANQPNNTGLDAAILKYGECLNKEPHFHLGYAKLAMAYLRKYRIEHNASLLTLARQNAEKAADVNSTSAKGLLSRAQVSLYSGDTNEALSYIDKSLKADPGNPETLLFKAQAFIYLNRWADAEQVYRDIIKERPNYWPAYNNIGWMLSRQAKYKLAAEAFDAAAMSAPNVALPLANLGQMYMDIGKHEEAVDASNRSIARSPTPGAFLNLGDMAFIDKNYRAALGYYENAVALEPNAHLVWRDIGDCHAMLGQAALMREDYAKAAKLLSADLKSNPRSGPNWMTLSFYHAKIGDSAAALADITNAEGCGAEDVRSKFMKVQTLAVLGRKKEALDLLVECMKKGLSPVEVDLALDLKEIRGDPRYLSLVEKNSSYRPAAS